MYIGSTQPSHAEVDAAIVASVRDRIAAEGIADRVIFVDRTSDISPYLRASDIFAVPSSREGLSNALLEAMSCGLPCVVAAIEGVTDSVIDAGTNGFIVAAGDHPALTAILQRLLEDDGLRRRIGEGARRTMLDRYAIDLIADRYFALYSEMTGAASA